MMKQIEHVYGIEFGENECAKKDGYGVFNHHQGFANVDLVIIIETGLMIKWSG